MNVQKHSTAAAPCATSSNPYETGPFRHVADMETPLTVANDLLRGIEMIAETLGQDERAVVQQIAGLAIKEIGAAEALRVKLFRLTHPNRAKLEAAGCPE